MKLAALLLLFAAPLPEAVYADLAGTSHVVTIPQGRWSIAAGKEPRPARSNLTIKCRFDFRPSITRW